MFKKGYSSLLVLVLSMMLMMGLTACGSDDTANEADASEPVAAAEQETPEPEVVVEECDEEALLAEKAAAHFNNLGESKNMMKADAFKEQFELSRDSVFVLDIRGPEDFAAGHLEGAVNIPFGKIGQKLSEIPTDKEVAVICYSGQTASQTTGVLKMAGFNAKAIVGGFPAVEKAGFELVN